MTSCATPSTRHTPSPEPNNDGLIKQAQAHLESLSRRSDGCTPHSDHSEAWECFYRTYDPVIRKLVRARVRSPDRVSDDVQEVWMTLIHRLPRFRHDARYGGFDSWLYVLVRRSAIDQGRRSARQSGETLQPEAAAILFSREPDPRIACNQQLTQALVNDVLTELRTRVSLPNYQIIQLRWVEQRTIREVAVILNLTPQQVRYRHHRTMEKLRELANLRASEVLHE